MRAPRRQVVRLLAVGLIVAGIAPAGCNRPASSPRSKGPAATALLRVSMRPNSLLPSGNRSGDMQEYKIYKATQAQLVKSRMVLTAALRKPGITELSICKREQNDPISWLQNHLEATFPDNSEIMLVRLADRNTEEAAKLVNAVVDAYIAEVVDVERSQNARGLANLEEVQASKEREIRNRRTTLKQLADELGTADRDMLKFQMQFASQELSENRQALRQAQSDLRKAAVERRVLQAALARLEKRAAAKTPAEGAAGPQPELRRIAEEMSALVTQLGQVVVTLSDAQLSQRLQNDLVTIQQQVTGWQGLLDMHVARFRTAELRDQIEDAELRLDAAAEEVATLEKDVAARREEFNRLGQSSVDLEMMRADLENLELVVRDIAAKRQRREIDRKSTPRVALLQRAESPNLPTGPPPAAADE